MPNDSHAQKADHPSVIAQAWNPDYKVQILPELHSHSEVVRSWEEWEEEERRERGKKIFTMPVSQQ